MRGLLFRLEYFWRQRIVYPFLKIIIGRPLNETAIDLKDVRKILFLRHDRIGDMIVTTPIFRILKQNYPELKISVIAAQANREIIRYNTSVNSIHMLPANPLKKILMMMKIRSEKYDVVVNFIFNRTTSIALLLRFIAKKSITVSQGDAKYRFYFDRYCTLQRSSDYMVKLLAEMMKRIFLLTMREPDLDYEIVVDPQSRKDVDLFLSKKDLQPKTSVQPSNYIVFNLSAVDAERKISVDQARAIIFSLAHSERYKIVLVTAPDDKAMQKQARLFSTNPRCILFLEKGYGSLLQLAVLIENASAVLTPDTSVIHFAAAMKTPVLGFFTPLQGMQEWLPFHVRYASVMAGPNRPVSEIPIQRLLEELNRFLNEKL
jgi:ADP-heptose:LPS heptosyltransferase